MSLSAAYVCVCGSDRSWLLDHGRILSPKISFPTFTCSDSKPCAAVNAAKQDAKTGACGDLRGTNYLRWIIPVPFTLSYIRATRQGHGRGVEKHRVMSKAARILALHIGDCFLANGHARSDDFRHLYSKPV